MINIGELVLKKNKIEKRQPEIKKLRRPTTNRFPNAGNGKAREGRNAHPEPGHRPPAENWSRKWLRWRYRQMAESHFLYSRRPVDFRELIKVYAMNSK